MNRSLTLLLIISVTLSLASVSNSLKTCGCGTIPRCPPCSSVAGCRIFGCPCVHDGFQLSPGYEPLNAPRPAGCPLCPCSVCDNYAEKCPYPYSACDADKVAKYKQLTPIENNNESGTVIIEPFCIPVTRVSPL